MIFSKASGERFVPCIQHLYNHLWPFYALTPQHDPYTTVKPSFTSPIGEQNCFSTELSTTSIFSCYLSVMWLKEKEKHLISLIILSDSLSGWFLPDTLLPSHCHFCRRSRNYFKRAIVYCCSFHCCNVGWCQIFVGFKEVTFSLTHRSSEEKRARKENQWLGFKEALRCMADSVQELEWNELDL